jgi:hypothetical protein
LKNEVFTCAILFDSVIYQDTMSTMNSNRTLTRAEYVAQHPNSSAHDYARYLRAQREAFFQSHAPSRGYRPARRASRSPAVGSAEWCETRGDDLGASGDY